MLAVLAKALISALKVKAQPLALVPVQEALRLVELLVVLLLLQVQE